MSESYTRRFGGIQRLYGLDNAEHLRRSHVCVVGIGGVGSWAAEALARTGIGTLTLIDLDDICVTNTNRQIQALAQTIGRDKTEVMRERLLSINPELIVHCVTDFLTEDTLADYLRDDFDVLVDCIDNVRAKAAIIAACKRKKLPVIVAGGAGGQTDPSKIQIADLAKSFNDPLLAKVKSRLRRDHGFAKGEKSKFGVECVFSSEQLKYPQADGSVCAQKPADNDGEAMRLDCSSGFGASVMVTGSFGFFLAARAVEKLLQRKI